MTLEHKLLELQGIFDDSEMVRMVESHFDEESAEQMILELKSEIIKLLEK